MWPVILRVYANQISRNQKIASTSMTTFASAEGTRRYAARFPKAADGHFRDAQRLAVSSLGIGTYLGNPDAKTDRGYTAAIVEAAQGGLNGIDAAINYRFQS